MEPVEPGSADFVAAATAKVEIRRIPFTCGFSSGKRRLLLLEGRETTSEGGNSGLREALREGMLLLLSLKLQASEVSFYSGDSARARTHTHTHPQTHTDS